MDRLKSLVESRHTERVIMVLILVNAVTLGLETVPAVMERIGPALLLLDKAILAVFVVEIAARLAVHRLRFFGNAWNVFDFTVVAIALVPATGAFSVLRALRVLRLLRLVSMVPSLRRVVGAMVGALPGMGSVIVLLTLVFYVFAVMSTKLFGASFPDWFGSIAASAYTLFQVMTLESWSMGIVRPVMEVYPYAWAFFVPFIVVTTFTVLNLFIGIVVSAMQAVHEEETKTQREAERAADQAASVEVAAAASAMQDVNATLLDEIRALRREMEALRELRGRSDAAE
ncbi:ion transporter [Salinarimonas sp. NSM]|uniref:ion transporter n=1 Tax=Salinarimonas sp. NSM TaxID=3458003 RepID=UPI004036C609